MSKGLQSVLRRETSPRPRQLEATRRLGVAGGDGSRGKVSPYAGILNIGIAP